MLDLNSPVAVRLGKDTEMTGIVIGRAFSDPPRYDVQFDNGQVIGNLPADRVTLLTEKVAA